MSGKRNSLIAGFLFSTYQQRASIRIVHPRPRSLCLEHFDPRRGLSFPNKRPVQEYIANLPAHDNANETHLPILRANDAPSLARARKQSALGCCDPAFPNRRGTLFSGDARRSARWPSALPRSAHCRFETPQRRSMLKLPGGFPRADDTIWPVKPWAVTELWTYATAGAPIDAEGRRF